MTEISSHLESVAKGIQKSEAEVMTLALQIGLKQLWREYTLGQYLLGKSTREQVIETVGIDLVELAERQHSAMLEDLGSAQNLLGILSAKCPVFMGLSRTDYGKLFLYDPLI